MTCRSIPQRRKLPVADPGDRKRRRGGRDARPSSRSISPRARRAGFTPLWASAWPAPRRLRQPPRPATPGCGADGSAAVLPEHRSGLLRPPCGSVAADPAYPAALPAARDAGLNPQAGGAVPSSEIGPRKLGIVLNELSPRFYVGAHQIGEKAIGLVGVVDGDLQQGAHVRIHRRGPQLFGVHLA